MSGLLTLTVATLLVATALPACAQSLSIQVESPWAFATPGVATTGAAYMTIDNKSNAPDRLIEMTVVDGTMRMRELVDRFPIPVAGSVVLRPGRYHVMLIGLKAPLKAGETFPVTPRFGKAGNTSVQVPVREMGAAQETMPGMSKPEMKR